MYDFTDQLKEICLLGNDLMPMPSGEYLSRATSLIPELTDSDKTNFEHIQKLLIDCLVLMQEMLQEKNTPRAEISLVDAIAQDLQQKLGLVNLQVKE